ncbi:conserved hypothetical protein [Cupriavidus taiwanensis]|uniref:hypothetical protein n=1 Tax=Cupriavidus taiwanensis TaxID=164546 RepID=UPI000E138594|nr:hypothetical protein [Cupriavidus taiwanensis]SPA25899.1 conserved hypothetical protein [Cupriavidus taiwanensis]
MSSNNITTVRQHLLDTLADLRNRDNPMEIERARAVADVARVLVDSAKVEVDYLKATGAQSADFLEGENKQPALPSGITGVTRHVLKG